MVICSDVQIFLLVFGIRYVVVASALCCFSWLSFPSGSELLSEPELESSSLELVSRILLLLALGFFAGLLPAQQFHFRMEKQIRSKIHFLRFLLLFMYLLNELPAHPPHIFMCSSLNTVGFSSISVGMPALRLLAVMLRVLNFVFLSQVLSVFVRVSTVKIFPEVNLKTGRSFSHICVSFAVSSVF